MGLIGVRFTVNVYGLQLSSPHMFRSLLILVTFSCNEWVPLFATLADTTGLSARRGRRGENGCARSNLARQGIPLLSMPGASRRFFSQDKRPVAVREASGEREKQCLRQARSLQIACSQTARDR